VDGAPIASNLDELSEKLASEEVELSILINGRLRGRRKIGGFQDLVRVLVEESSSSDILVRVKLTGPGGEYRVYAYNGVIVGVIGETSGGRILGSKALRVLEDLRDVGTIDVWEVSVESLPGEVKEALGAARLEEARPPPPEGWVGLELHGFKVVRLHSDKGAFNYIMAAEAPWGEEVALKIPRIEPGGSSAALAVYRMISEAQVLARLYTVDRRVIEANLDALGYPRDLAELVSEGRKHVVKVYAISAPRRDYRDVKEYLYHPPFVAMEIADGDLEDLEASEPRDELVSSVASQVGSALALAHTLGMGHFDLKPANVLYKRLGGGYILKLSDFTGYNRLDSRFLVDLFTPEYSDPLLVASRGRAGTPASDVFNLAALLYRVARGAPCHCVWVLNTLMLSALSGRPPPRRALDALKASDPRVAAYVSRVESAVAAMKREALGMSGVIERVRDSYEECIQHATEPLREPLRSVLRRALTLNRRARPRDAIDYYTRNLLSL
jgi:serine/threonine protein kinase